MSRADAEALIARAVAAGLELWREGAELRFRAPKGTLAPELRDALRAGKADLLDALREGERHLFASDGQRRVWLADRMAPGSPAYNIPMAAVRLRGALDVDRLRASLDALVVRHEALRARFPAMAAEPVQVIAPELAVPLRLVDLASLPEEQREAAAWRAVRADVQGAFDVTVGPLLRTTLLALSPREHWLAVTMHHVVADVWSMQVFLRELAQEYAARVDGRADAPAASPAGFRDLLHARRGAQAAALEEGLRHWRDALADAAPRLDLPFDRPRPERRGVAGDHEELALDADAWNAVREHGRRRDATPFMVLFAAFAAWLSRHTGQEDVLAGCPVWGRPDAESAAVVGLFADTLPLRVSTAGDPSFDELVERARRTTLEAYRHESVPLARIIEDLRAARAGEGPIVSVLFDVLAFGAELQAAGGGIDFESLPLERGATDVDLFFIVSPEGGGLRLWLEYARDVFDAETVRAMLRRFARLLAAAVREPSTRLSQLRLETAADEERRRGHGARADNRARAALALGTTDVEQISIVDGGGAPVPPGCRGEVMALVGGAWRALDRFGCFGGEGRLELRGRVSRGVRVRGSRVDRDEMEAVLREDAAVEDVAVLAVNERDLAAFVVARGPAPGERLIARARARSGAGLGPVAVIPVTRLPRTAAGAVDEAALARLPIVGEAEVEKARAELVERIAGAVEVAVELPRSSPQRVHAADVLGAEDAPRAIPAAAADVLEEAAPAAAGPPAVVDGGPPVEADGTGATLGEVLLERVRRAPAQEIVFVEGGAVTRTSCAELLARALVCGGGLRAAGVQAGVVVLMLDAPREIVGAFWGAVAAGVAPLVVPPPTDEGDAEAGARLRALLESLDRPPVVTSQDRAAGLRETLGGRVLTLETLADGPALREPAAVDPSDTAFLTLTSGSTGVPKAVRLTHRGLLARARGTDRLAGFSSGDVILNWLPLDHVGSLSDWHVRPLGLGSRMIYARKEDVLGDPLRWLELIEAHGVTHGWAPNFAFALVAEAVAAQPGCRFDLSSVRALLTAGESISPSVVARFLRALAPFGLRDDVILPAFGMAELGSGVTYADRRPGTLEVLERAHGVPLVDLGPPIPGVALRVVDAAGAVRPEGVPGRLQVKGAPLFAGYANAAAETARVLAGDGWFDTGDVGVIVGGRLGLTGRAKETLVIRGGNYPCAEVEAAAEVDGVRAAHVVACALVGADGEELAIAFVPDAAHASGPPLLATVRRLRESLARRIGIGADRVLPIAAADIPRTPLGKIRRGLLAQAIAEGRFASAERGLDLLEGNERTLPRYVHRRRFVPRPLAAPALPAAARVLVVDDDPRRGQELAEAFRRVGCTVQVAGGAAALRDLDDATPELVVDLRGLGGGVEEPLAPAVRTLAVYQALAARRPERVRLVIVTSGAQVVAPGERVDPARAALPALLLTMAQEAAWLEARHVDVPSDAWDERTLWLELSAPAREVESAWRGGVRHVPALDRVDLAAASGPPLANGATCVLGGGLSEVGLELARELRRRYGARLLLLGRPPLASGSEKIRSLAGLPGEARYASVDVTDAAAVTAAVANFERAVGAPVEWIFHLAGRYDEGALVSQDAESLRRTAAAKVDGARVLGELARQRQVRLVAFSSLTGWWGGALVGSYALANRWLDAYVARLAADGVDARSLAFSVWDGVGISRRFAAPEALAAQGLETLRPSRATALTLAALRVGPGVLGLGLDDTHPAIERRIPGDAEAPVLAAWLPEGTPEAVPPVLHDAAGRPILLAFRRGARRTGEAQPQNELEAGLVAIWKDVLRLSNVSVLDNFFDLGGHSVLVFQVHRRLLDLVARDVPLVKLFQFPTIRTLAAFLAEAATTSTAPAAEERAAARRTDVRRLRSLREARGGASS